MEILDAELRLQTSEDNVVPGLKALNAAQDYFETLAAARANILGGAVGTVVTATDTEATTFPSGVLRIDRMQRLNSSSIPHFELRNLKHVGGHYLATPWPLNLLNPGVGGPTGYWTNGTNIYWSPRPDAIYTIRYYGFSAATSITAAGTFLYPDIVALPLATFAVRLMKIGKGDEMGDITGLARDTFFPVLDTLGTFVRDQAPGFDYAHFHSE